MPERSDRRPPDGEPVLSAEDLADLMQAVLARNCLFRIRANGLSMSPFIRNGDVITIAPLGQQRPRVGDVVAARYPRSRYVMVHRLIARRRDTFLTRGDNSSVVDAAVRLSDVLGIVVAVERNGCRIRLGMGPEKLLMGLCARYGLLYRIISVVDYARGQIARWHQTT